MYYQDFVDKLKKRGSVPGLGAIGALLDQLGHPERKLRIIHIAGTNGKGSVSAYLGTILKCAGYHVGRYISPTIQCYEERYQINGGYISREDLENLYDKVYDAILKVEAETEYRPTLFEAETAAAFLYFYVKRTEFAIIECGMGGLLDATNIIEKPYLSVITSISYDHKQFLGDTLEEIARQKGGIIKEGVPIVLAKNLKSVQGVIEALAKEKSAKFVNAADHGLEILDENPEGTAFSLDGKFYETNLAGRHQVDNAVCAILAAEELMNDKDVRKITVPAIRQGIGRTRWPGRLELVSRHPLFYRDGAHNPDGARMLSQFLEKYFTNQRIIYIIGVLKDKEYDKMMDQLIPLGSEAYVFRPRNERGLDAETLARTIRRRGIPAKVCQDINESVGLACSHAEGDDVIVACGSLSFMEEMNHSENFQKVREFV